jgi:bifunctional NMN adenylyltransferase/nudix hydrolase
MLNLTGPAGDLGVIVGRFQTPYLTPGHCELIETVRSRHPKFAIVLGVARVIPTKTNPLDVATRAQMIQEIYPGVEVISKLDERSDVAWSQNLDRALRSIHPYEKIVLYGGRDSFITRYSGQFPTVQLDEVLNVSGSQARQAAFHKILPTADFRSGICYAQANQWPRINPTVDVAIERGGQVLLAHKTEDGDNQWRFVGGFIDAKETAEQAARREAAEETGAAVGNLEYIISTPIDDWRYRGTNQSIFTTFFAAKYLQGPCTAADDVQAVKWFDIVQLDESVLVPEHRVLLDAYLRHRGLRGEVQVPGQGDGVTTVTFTHTDGIKTVTSPVPYDQLVMEKE